ncbi:metallopeptidase family protein [Candidatus Saccharibacteria bacterium]|nr:metallopeptidase family protein [Candidatus Saccharibacteria bacterium]
MLKVSSKTFLALVGEAINAIPTLYQKHLQNVAFIIEDNPSQEQRQRLRLNDGSLLFGLYEGVPLTERGGRTKLLPDKITIFKKPLERVSQSLPDLRDQIAHTVWHEVAHYYGLGHKRIYELEQKASENLQKHGR